MGHTQNAGDSMHARIESHAKNMCVYTQNQWAELMRDCKEDQKYEVVEKSQDDIFNFDPLAEKFKWCDVRVSQVRELKIFPGRKTVSVRYDFDEQPRSMYVLKKNVSIGEILRLNLIKAYTSKLPLSKKKKDDLRKMVEKRIVPNNVHDVFYDLLSI